MRLDRRLLPTSSTAILKAINKKTHHPGTEKTKVYGKEGGKVKSSMEKADRI